MSRILSVMALVFILISCLKRDVLNQPAEGNFSQWDFFTTGDFQNSFDISILDSTVVQIPNSQGAIRCKPILTFKLEESFRRRLEESRGASKLK